MAASAFGYPAMLRTLSLVLILMEALQTTQGVFTEESARRIVGNLATGWSASLTITALIHLNVANTAPINAASPTTATRATTAIRPPSWRR